MVFDKLVAEGKFHAISEPLKKEFGDPEAKKEKPVVIESPKTKKKAKVE